MKQFVDKMVSSALIIILGVMVIAVVWQVFSRYVLTDPSTYTDELARFLMIWLGLLGAAYVSGKNMHLAIDILPNKLKGKSKLNLLVFIDILILFFVISVMVVGGGRLVYMTFILNQTSASLQIPLAYVYTILPLSGLLIAYYKIENILLMLRNPSSIVQSDIHHINEGE
jgi:TRAP-type C4-dicarboxylate transport system permease small subunit